MDNQLQNKISLMESIIQDVAKSLFQKWANSLPEDQRSEESLFNLNKNAVESTFFVVQAFMAQFNAEAENLKSASDEQQPSID